MNFSKFSFCASICLALLHSCSKDEEIIKSGDYPFTVVEYLPAPGQFINEGFTAANMTQANTLAQEYLEKGWLVSLGTFGGSITVRSDEPLANKAGYDFAIVGNPFDGSSEPGIVWVSADVNGNSLPDDPWYELAGSHTPRRNYSVTYTRPSTPGAIAWSDSDGATGAITHLSALHAQNYYPAWVSSDTYTLTGSVLPHRSLLVGNEWENQSFGGGYADNMGSDVETKPTGDYRRNRFDIANAIDANGNPANLPAIDFIRVQSAILHEVPTLGELSTEVSGFEKL